MSACISYINLKPVIIPIISLFLFACGSDSNDTPEDQSDFQAATTDKDVVFSQVYQKILEDQRFPVDFYQEPDNNSNLFYTIKHISNHDIGLYDVSFSYRLCENDFSDASQKSETAANGSNSTLINNSSNDLYYEFLREKNNDANTVIVQRMYKCSVYNVNESNNYKGQYSYSNADDYLRFIEYQWYFSYNNNYGNIVISSESSDDSTSIKKAIIINAKITDTSTCNEVSIIENHYDLDITTGVITYYQIVTDIFLANYNNSSIEICS